MTSDRHLAWEGCWNARDLGGLRLRDGGQTRWGTTVRMDSPQRLTDVAWQEIWDYGIRTVIDLRNTEEIKPDGRPARLTTLQVPLDEEKDPGFVVDRGLDCTPLYYPAFLDRFPGRVADVFRAIASAGPGGVVYHCAAGRDRTGLITLVLLALAGVEPEDIAADNALSGPRLKPAWVELALGDQSGAIDDLLATHGTTVHQAAMEALTSFDAEKYLLSAGLTEKEIAVIRARLV
ncbi:MAG: tyrosine-protein phosphatase [Kibdelosporangium sp.]